MAELDFVKVDVFTQEAYSGNPAGVVFDADGLDEMQMQRIAFEVGSPVTSFVLRSKKADVRLRFFSPTSEEPLSGHGTIGALWCLADRGAFGSSPGGKVSASRCNVCRAGRGSFNWRYNSANSRSTVRSSGA